MIGASGGELALTIAKAVGRRLTPEHSQKDDLVQEAALAIMRVQASDPDRPPEYLYGVGRHAILNKLRGRPWTGEQGQQGHKHRDPLRTTGLASLDWADDAGQPALAHYAQTPSGEDQIVARLDMDRALRRLPTRQRQVAECKLWGYTNSETATALGLAPKTADRYWHEGAKPKLREMLEVAA